MEKYSIIEEWALSTIGNQPDMEDGISMKTVIRTCASSIGWYLVKAERIYRRGKEVEDRVLQETNDAEKAWKAAEAYYDAASFKGNADAWYRKGVQSLTRFDPEFAYADLLTKAANHGHKQAIRDYVYRYEEFRARTITKNAYRKMKEQEKTFFQCCKILTIEGDLYAQWELAECYLYGSGVKEDRKKAIEIMKDVMSKGEFSEEEAETKQKMIDFYSCDK